MSRAPAVRARNTNNATVACNSARRRWRSRVPSGASATMAVNLAYPSAPPPVAGVSLGVVEAGIRKPGRRDLVVMKLALGSQVAAVFTRNAFQAAPVMVARHHLGRASPQALVINTGYANAGTGEQGMVDARMTCKRVAELLDCAPEQVLPFSTGVIGERLPMARLLAGLPAAAALRDDAWLEAAHGIMTTDTVPKARSASFEVGGRRYQVSGIAKGAGMIRPDMATMLAFVATDAPVAAGQLHSLFSYAVARSFNRITVDGDMSTNDASCLIATGAGGGEPLLPGSKGWQALSDAVLAVCEPLAQAIVRDGEGATRFVTIDVEQARDGAEARRVADAIAHSPLVKTAFFAGDPNWGRILAAVGRAGIEALDIGGVDIWLDDVQVVEGGALSPSYTEAQGASVLAAPEFSVTVSLGARGPAKTRIWTCDLSEGYVRINAEYRT